MSDAKPVAKKKFKPPTLIMKLPAQTRQPQPQENERWTQSGAFVVPKSGYNDTMKVTQEGVKLRNTQGALNSDVGMKLKRENLKVIRPLGSGASGKVNLEQDIVTNEMYAVKYVYLGPNTKRILDQELKQLFVKHPRLVSTIQAFIADEDQSLRLVQEYMDAGNLEDILKECISRGVKIPEDVISVIARQVLEGLVQLHTRRKECGGKVQMHRDLKPANILLNKNGECKVADFGITVEVATLGQSTVVGSPPYMSPERIQGGRYSTPADIWAIGLIVAEMALGRFPFAKGQMMQLLEQITATTTIDLPTTSTHLTEFVHALMKQDPGQRPQALDALDLPFIQEHASIPTSAVGEWLASTKLVTPEEPKA
eukprot:TRINITY_DN10399_c0_g1_i1.p1 TRINITY_DN10399_c0_g1~~TRINITY_DN10399_c0_g1_i1.p1  ORF type:complete len:384 (+),score=88.33 TRINITY_DN10399_c0_g1_i1:47-1153(+)